MNTKVYWFYCVSVILYALLVGVSYGLKGSVDVFDVSTALLGLAGIPLAYKSLVSPLKE